MHVWCRYVCRDAGRGQGHQSKWMGLVSSVCVCVCGAGMCAGSLGEDWAPVKLDGTSE